MELRSPRDLFSCLHYPLSWFHGFCVERRKTREAHLEKLVNMVR